MDKETLERLLQECCKGDLVEITFVATDKFHVDIETENPLIICQPFYYVGRTTGYGKDTVSFSVTNTKRQGGHLEPAFSSYSHEHLINFRRVAEKD
ncbi:MAG: hypothetical protein AABW64_01500 [Nanoarchaeota archaeon]